MPSTRKNIGLKGDDGPIYISKEDYENMYGPELTDENCSLEVLSHLWGLPVNEDIKSAKSMDVIKVMINHDGMQTPYEIIPNEGHFGIKFNGVLIAEIQQNEDWEQTSGETLRPGIFEQLIFNIESHFD